MFRNIGIEAGNLSRACNNSFLFFFISLFCFQLLYYNKFNKYIYKVEYNWREKSDRRRYFEDLTASMGLDPLLPDTWYSLKKFKIPLVCIFYNYSIFFKIILFLLLIFCLQHFVQHLKKYSGSVANSIIMAFPEVNFEKSKFIHNTR